LSLDKIPNLDQRYVTFVCELGANYIYHCNLNTSYKKHFLEFGSIDTIRKMTGSDFMALPGFYKALFLYIEPGELRTFWWLCRLCMLFNDQLLPVSTISPAFMAWIYPGAKWFYHELIPSSASALPLEPKSSMAILQLTNCSSFDDAGA